MTQHTTIILSGVLTFTLAGTATLTLPGASSLAQASNPTNRFPSRSGRTSFTGSLAPISVGFIRGRRRPAGSWKGRTAGGRGDAAEASCRGRPLLGRVLHAHGRPGQDVRPGPTEVPELAWRKGPEGLTIAVANGTPGWHAPSGRMIAIGGKILLYTAVGDYASLEKLPRSYEVSYATYDPAADKWTPWRNSKCPKPTASSAAWAAAVPSGWSGPTGRCLCPLSSSPAIGADYQATVLHCGFDGGEMKYLGHGDELAVVGGRGFTEPSLALFRGKYYLTLRNDARAYATTSDDGQHFAPVKAWTFDDGQDLGSYNTQAHWLAHSDGLFLSYTRRGANNDHIARNRAPIFVAQVDPVKLQVLRKTEQIPAAGARRDARQLRRSGHHAE